MSMACFYRVYVPKHTTLSSSDVIALSGNYSSLYSPKENPDVRVYVQLKRFTEVELI